MFPTQKISVVEKWSDTAIKIDTIDYLWIIHDFNFHMAKSKRGEFLQSDIFTATTNDDCKWYLKVYPNSSEESTDEGIVSVSLNLDNTSKCKRIYAEFKFYIFIKNENNENLFTGIEDSEKKIHKFVLDPSSGKPVSSCSYPTFIHRNKLIHDDGSSILPNNELIIYSRITFSLVNHFTNSYHVSESRQPQPNVHELRLFNDLSKLYKNEEFTDVVLSVKDKQYRVHKLVLIARSPVFAEMFRSESTIENHQSQVDITDLDDKVVEQMLNYIYTGNCENLEDLATDLLKAANKYGLDELKIVCRNALIKKLLIENSLDILITADLYNASALKSEVISYILTHMVDIKNTSAWKKFTSSYPKLVVEIIEASMLHN